MNFRLSTFLLVLALVTALFGWHFERRHYRLEYQAHVEAAEMKASVIRDARSKTTLFLGIGRHASGEITTLELRELARCQLWRSVANIYAVSQRVPESSSILDTPSYQNIFRLQARQTLALMGIGDIDDLKNLLTTEPSVFGSRDSLINSKGEFETEFLYFAEQALSDPSTYYR